jgi:hypothetical protein
MFAKPKMGRWLGFACFTFLFAASGHAQQRTGGFLGFGPTNCVLYYVSEPTRIQRFNICTQQALPDFNTTQLPDPRGVQQIQSLPDGGLLVANVSVIARFREDGRLVRIYDKPGEDCWSGLALEQNGQAFWASSSCHSGVTRFDLTSDAHMFGGGSEFSSTGTQITYGADLHCDASVLPNYLQVFWGNGSIFYMQTMKAASCTGSPFNTHSGTGTGTINGEGGATALWTLVDNGEPGIMNDTGQLVIKNAAGQTMVEISGKIVAGNLIAR